MTLRHEHRKTPIDLNASTRSGGLRRPVQSLLRAGDVRRQLPDIGEQTLGCLTHRSNLRRPRCRGVSTFANEVTIVAGNAERTLSHISMFANILTNVSVAFIRSRLDWGNDWGSMEVMCRERAALAKKKWNSGWQKQRSGSSSGNLLTHSRKDASPRPRVIPDPTINRLHATHHATAPKGTRLYADVTGCSRYSTSLRADLFNRYTAKNWNAAMTRGPITFSGSCCNKQHPHPAIG
jgi:hypothetical protein